MRRITRYRPSAGLVLAFIALFVTMSGVGYTAAKINGKRLKSRSVSHTRIKKDTLTGVEIKESTLGTVPNATSAEGAGNVGGFKFSKLTFRANLNTGTTTIFDNAGLTIRGACSAAGVLLVSAITTKDNSMIRGVNVATAAVTSYEADDDFDTGQTFNFNANTNEQETFVFTAADGTTATGTFLAQQFAAAGGLGSAANRCVVAGTIQYSG